MQRRRRSASRMGPRLAVVSARTYSTGLLSSSVSCNPQRIVASTRLPVSGLRSTTRLSPPGARSPSSRMPLCSGSACGASAGGATGILASSARRGWCLAGLLRRWLVVACLALGRRFLLRLRLRCLQRATKRLHEVNHVALFRLLRPGDQLGAVCLGLDQLPHRLLVAVAELGGVEAPVLLGDDLLGDLDHLRTDRHVGDGVEELVLVPHL